jgi:chromosome segregation ATPase
MEAEEKVRELGEMRDDLEEELENLKNRLEKFDDVFRFENLVFGKIATVINRARISPLQAFE